MTDRTRKFKIPMNTPDGSREVAEVILARRVSCCVGGYAYTFAVHANPSALHEYSVSEWFTGNRVTRFVSDYKTDLRDQAKSAVLLLVSELGENRVRHDLDRSIDNDAILNPKLA